MHVDEDDESFDDDQWIAVASDLTDFSARRSVIHSSL